MELGLSKGVSGYVYHCVPVVIHCWLSHQDNFQAAMRSIILCGGDTDTNAAMVGGILGAKGGPDSIPNDLIDGLMLCPFSMKSFQGLSAQLQSTLESGQRCQPLSPFWGFVLVRNVFFLAVVAVSEASKRSSLLGGLLASLPLVSCLGMIWLYIDTGSTEKVADLSKSVFWLVLPSLPFFLMLPFLLKKGWGFYSSLGLSTAVMIGLYYGMMVLLSKSGIENGA